MKIPEIRERLFEKAVEYNDNELLDLAVELCRRSPKKRAAKHSKKMTKELREAIVAYARAHEDVSQTNIARVFDVNAGRVSESLRGYRH